MKTVTRELYEASDGTLHETEAACLQHEKAVEAEEKETSYWVIRHDPDLTETGSCLSRTYAKVRLPGNNHLSRESFMLDWCFATFGRPIAFVQNIAPTTAWEHREITRHEFDNRKGVNWGGYTREPKVVSLILKDQRLV